MKDKLKLLIIIYCFSCLVSCIFVFTPPPMHPYYQDQLQNPSIIKKKDNENILYDTKENTDIIEVSTYKIEGKKIIFIEIKDSNNDEQPEIEIKKTKKK